ncbi:myotubularin-related protein 12 [Ranitomeya variabilis]|uniref:myotubularin-related protein 12 n=1 Tax=Ranitomeya variabilis TaxID=490064 RepID=UPI004056BD1D
MLGLGSGGAAKSPKVPSFVSYLTPEEIDVKEKAEQAAKVDDVPLLPGEMLHCEAGNVFKISQDEGSQRGVCGRLVCTNFKITFLCEDGAEDNNAPEFKNKIVGENDITLQCVDQLCAVYDDKKKVPILGAPLKKQPEKLLIYCRDFRVFHFGLRYAKEDEVNRIVNGIIHHTLSPKPLKLIFLFSYTAAAPRYAATSAKDQTVLFEKHKDWRMELDRTKGNMFYKVFVNETYKGLEWLPPYFIVPANLPEESVYKFHGRGIPIWCWSTQNGAALFKMASLPKEVDDSSMQEQKAFLNGVEKILHRPPYEEVRIEDLSVTLPSLSDIQAAYTRFKQLFLIDNSTEFWVTDFKWFSLLHTSNWLEIIRQCLKKSIEVIEYLENKKINVILKEDTASDFCCVVSSLVQIMMDPHYRTRCGFQCLIQKEWVMGGHNFLDRCNHLRTNDGEAPVFLLFLDCVWQLVHQYPLAFEFSETYLTVLSDSINIPIFSTFFFNSAYQRDTHKWVEDGGGGGRQSDSFSFYSVWDWSVQFELKALTFLNNPLYEEKSKQEKSRKGTRPKHHRQMSLPLTQSKSSNKRGFFKEEPGPFIKSLLGKRISKLISSPDEGPSDYRVFYENWHRKPMDVHGLILPHIEGPDICVWAQRHLRWIPEAQVLGGGNVAATQRVLDLLDEIKSLKNELKDRPTLSHRASKENDADARRKKSVRRSSMYPFAHIPMNFVRPSISTATWWSWEAGDDLVNRDDEDLDLGVI